MKTTLVLTAVLFSLAAAGHAGAAGTETIAPSVTAAADYDAGKTAVEARDWPAAIAHLTAAVEADPTSADAENLLGFSYRKSGDYASAQKHYWKALKLDPDHRGAREYLGEAFLELKNLQKAEEQLAALARICPAGCEERDDLSKAIEAFKRAQNG